MRQSDSTARVDSNPDPAERETITVAEEESTNDDAPETGVVQQELRVIKRYSNRKLYDTKDSRYVTLLQIAEMVRAGEEVQIIDNATKEDKTDITLALIISEELKAKPRNIPLGTLKALIRHRSGKFLTQLRESPMGKLIPVDADESELATAKALRDEEEAEMGNDPRGIRATIEQWQSVVDERIRAILPNFSTIRELQSDITTLKSRIESLESKLAEKQSDDSAG